nr:AMP-binding protein [Burkholderiales bacterium]
MPSTTPQADHYAREYHNWRWQVPEFFNVSTACVHRWAAHAERSASTAITWEDESGSSARITYGELSA